MEYLQEKLQRFLLAEVQEKKPLFFHAEKD